MERIAIQKIQFENYRQYGTGTITFASENNGNSMNIIIAQNGTGKTTLLNAITWCLYGKEYQISDEKEALPLLNMEKLDKLPFGRSISVSVAMTIIHDNSILEFKRTVEFTKVNQRTKRVINGIPVLTVTIMEKGKFKNPQIYKKEQADIIVKQYFDQTIYDYYFFDGEYLKSFFSSRNANTIQNAIYNISQVSLLQNVQAHLEVKKNETRRLIGKNKPELEKLNKEKERKEKDKETHEANKNRYDEQIKENSKRIAEINELMRGMKPIADIQEDRDSLERDRDKVTKEKKDFQERKSSFIREYAVHLSLYPSIKKILTYINEKEEKGELPPSIDIDVLRRLISYLEETHSQNCTCPMCNHDIDEQAIAHMKNVIAGATVSSTTSHYLKEIKGSLQDSMRKAKDFPKEKEKIMNQKADIDDRLSRIEGELAQINKRLINFGNGNGEDFSQQVRKLESERGDLERENRSLYTAIGHEEALGKTAQAKLDEIEKELKAAYANMDKSNKMQQQLDVYNDLYDNFSTVLKNITKSMRDMIEKTTMDIFTEMNWKKNTFGSIKINDNYSVSVYYKDGSPMKGTLGATEHMALAYAYILAIHEVSGKNCPLVIDSPIGRSSDKNRENISKTLLQISKEKQIIMFFTPDDYTDDVKKLYEGVVTVKNFSLSENEQYVEGIER